MQLIPVIATLSKGTDAAENSPIAASKGMPAAPFGSYLLTTLDLPVRPGQAAISASKATQSVLSLETDQAQVSDAKPWSFLQASSVSEGKKSVVPVAKDRKPAAATEVGQPSLMPDRAVDSTPAASAPVPMSAPEPARAPTVGSESLLATPNGIKPGADLQRAPSQQVRPQNSELVSPKNFDGDDPRAFERSMAGTVQSEPEIVTRPAGTAAAAAAPSLAPPIPLTPPTPQPAPKLDVRTSAETATEAQHAPPAESAAGILGKQGARPALAEKASSSDAKAAPPVAAGKSFEEGTAPPHEAISAPHAHADSVAKVGGSAEPPMEHAASLAALPHPVSTEGNASARISAQQAPAPPGATTQIAFQRLDQALPVTTLHAGPHRLSVGVEDPVRGWVEVRSESHFGDLSATVSVASEAVHGALRAELPALNGFLAEHQVELGRLSIEQNASHGSGAGGNAGDRDAPARPEQVSESKAILVEVGSPPQFGGYADATGVDIRA